MSRRAARQYMTAQKRLRALNAEQIGVTRASASLGMVRRGRGAYEGARRDTRDFKGWEPAAGSPATDTIPDLPELRARVRDMDRNTPLATGIIETTQDHVVGTGLFPVPVPDREVLGITEAQAQRFVEDALRLYRNVTDSTRLHLGDGLTGLQQQWTALSSTLVGGDIGIARRFRERPGDLLGLKLEYFEAERISNPLGRQDSEQLLDGMEFDEDGRNTRMWVSKYHPGERLYATVNSWRGLDVYGAETGEKQILHVMEHRRIGQPRGVSVLAPVIKLFKQGDEALGNELVASLVQSLFTVFIKQVAGDGDDDEVPLVGAGSSSHYGPAPDRSDIIRLGKGLVVRLNPGEEIQQASTNRPNANLGPFLEHVYTSGGAGVNIPFELLVKRFQQSYTAARASFSQAWRGFDRRQTWLVECFCQHVWEWIIDEGVLRGYIDAPGFHDDVYVRKAYCRAEWRGPTREQLDELKEVLAAERRVAAGFSTIEHETAGLTGLDSNLVHARRKVEVAQRVADGLEAPIVIASTQPTTPTRPRDLARPAPDNDREGPDAPARDDAADDDEATARGVGHKMIREAYADAAAA